MLKSNLILKLGFILKISLILKLSFILTFVHIQNFEFILNILEHPKPSISSLKQPGRLVACYLDKTSIIIARFDVLYTTLLLVIVNCPCSLIMLISVYCNITVSNLYTQIDGVRTKNADIECRNV